MKNMILISTAALALTACGGGFKVVQATPGVAGKNGHNSLVRMGQVDNTLCLAGGYSFNSGLDANDDGALDDAEIQSLSIICNGVQGLAGISGLPGKDGLLPSGFVPVTILKPCGLVPISGSEVFLKLPSGDIVASFSDNADGKNTRLSLLGQGNYVTTDGRGCQFSIDSHNNIVNEVIRK